MEFSLSTSWNAFRHTSGKDLIFEIKNLGFSSVELSFNITQSMVNDIALLVEQGEIKVSSTHNYCPIPDEFSRSEALPDCFSLAAINQDERRKAVEYTKRTIDTAHKLHAQAVVLHCGRVEMPDYTRRLISLYQEKGRDSQEFITLKTSMQQDREAKARLFFENALQSLDELNQHARIRKIRLGIENRFYAREIPSWQETIQIFERFKDSQLYYWHDVGHAYIMEKLGLVEPEAHLKQFSPMVGGIHLHDIADFKDHCPPGQGEFDFSTLTPHIKNNTLAVIEAHHPAKSLDVQASVAFLNKFGYGTDH
ncbi:MAG: sugar phosphate isomerase/epimerase [Candidatus Omnitrophica bacterium]|nr:sugar phosphate isomerase/epimerase [Candidatus Omnitrophota bacterium]